VDEAGVLNGARETQAAINELSSIGADVRVRTYNASPDGLDAILEDTINECRSWQHPEGGHKDNLVVVMLSMDPTEVGIYSGELYGSQLDDRTGSIQGDMGADYFREGKFDEGMAYGLTEVYDIIKPAQPTNWGAIGRVALWFLGGLAVIALIGFLLLWRRAHKQLAAARELMEEAQNDASSGLNELIRQLDETSSLLTVLVNVGAPNAADLKARLDGARTEYGQANSDYVENTNTVSEAESLSSEQVDSLTKAFAGIAERVAQAKANVDAVTSEVDSFMNRAQKVDTIHPQVLDSIMKAKADVTATANEGLNVSEATAKLAAADETYGDAMNALETQQGLQVLAHLDAATTAVAEALALRDQVVARRDAIQAKAGALDTQLNAAETALTEGTAAFDEMHGRYAESAWDDLQGNGTTATALVDEAEALMAQALEAARSQQWDEADRLQAEAEQRLAKAVSLMKSASTRLATLDECEQRMRTELSDAGADIDKATAYEARYDADVDDELREELAEARRQLAEAERLSHEVPCNPQAVVEAATAANATADRVFAQAATQVEAAERARRQAATELRNASEVVAAADEYLEDHDYHSQSSDDENLRQAKQALGRATEAELSADIIREAKRASKLAGDAHKRVKSRVQSARAAAQAERDDFYDTPGFPTVIVPSYPSTPSRSRAGGGTRRSSGSSSSWGGSSSSRRSSGGGGGRTTGSSSRW
jgi:hypothetical protein